MHFAEMLIAFAIALLALGAAGHVGVSAWLRLKRFEREGRPADGPPDGLSDEIAARLDRIERIVESTAIEVERVSEAQRWVATQLAERAPTPQLPTGPAAERVETPR